MMRFCWKTAKDKLIGNQIWHYPSGAEYSQCHTSAAGFNLGLEIHQLNRPRESGMNQLDWFASQILLAGEISAVMRDWVLPSNRDTTVVLGARARSFLHSNCSQCHRPGGTSQSGMDRRFTLDEVLMNVCRVSPMQGDLGIPQAELVAPATRDCAAKFNARAGALASFYF